MLLFGRHDAIFLKDCGDGLPSSRVGTNTGLPGIRSVKTRMISAAVRLHFYQNKINEEYRKRRIFSSKSVRYFFKRLHYFFEEIALFLRIDRVIIPAPAPPLLPSPPFR